MKHSIRLISLLTALLCILPLAVGCADTGTTDETTESAASSSVSETVSETTDSLYDKEGYLKDDLPDDLNFGGETITLLVWNDVEHEEFDISFDSFSGDIVEQSIIDRNANVESRLGCTLEFIRVDGNSDNKKQWNEYVGNSVSTNAHEFDIVAGYSVSVALNASSGYLYNLLDSSCKYLNFDKPWWSALLLEQASFGDNLFFASGDISRNALEMMYLCYANTNLLAEYSLENPQNYVETGDWTYAKFIEMTQGVYKDTDGNGIKNCEKDSGDTFGYITSSLHAISWFYGSGATICEKNADGQIVESPSFSGEKLTNTVDMLSELFKSESAILNSNNSAHQKAFGQGRSLFITERARLSHKVLFPDYGFSDFVILPCPKYDKEQENYITVMANPFTLYGIPADISDPEMASAFIECFASEGYRHVTPAVFEISLKTRYVMDSVSASMYDIIRENVTYDIGRLFSADLIDLSSFRNAITNSTPWTSAAKAASKQLQAKLPALNEALNKSN